MKVPGLKVKESLASPKRRFIKTTGEARSGGCRQIAEFLQLSDPARGVAFDGKRLVVDGGIAIGKLA